VTETMVGLSTANPRDYRPISVTAASYPAAPNPGAIAPLPPKLIPLFQSALATLASYAALPPDWDYEGGVPMTSDAQAAGIVMLNALASEHIVPLLSPLSDGGLLIEFTRGSFELTLDVDRSGAVQLYASLATNEYAAQGSAAYVAATLPNLFSLASQQR
jgi:hypothetical protein